jgi:hypothetical protein
MNLNKPLIVFIGIIGFFLYAVITGGIAIFKSDDFQGQKDIRLADCLKSDIYLSPKSEDLEIPFLLHYYENRKPFDLRLQIWDDSKSYKAVEITEVIIKYADGTVIRKKRPWFKTLIPYKQNEREEVFMMSDVIEKIVPRHEDLNLDFKGYLIKINGQKVSFKVSEHFKAESSFGITTFWEAIGSV